ncbi:hypothetical protein [Nisaea nitritireducens]|uniref:hypothetical protein n=1 Tax=Nisaea nitritireducens TaxID=568392 RepID=UPI00186616D1|nr:hypothetical protein [Nisaea nitritireducens]
MFSIQKILVLVAVITAIWYGFKLVSRLDAARKQKLKEAARSNGGNTPRTTQKDDVVDLVQNEDGTYGASKKNRKV